MVRSGKKDAASSANAVPAAGDGEAQENSVTGGPDAKNEYDKLAAGRPLMPQRVKAS